MKQSGTLVLTLLMMFFIAVCVHAGDLEPSAPPGPTMHTLTEIYDLVHDTNTKITSVPAEPCTGAAVAKTGQTTCYDVSGTVISCTGTGQDGDLQKGVDSPNPRFTDNGNGTVTDNLTGLIWLKNANAAGTSRNWITALSDIAQLNTDGTMNGNNCGDTSNGGSHQTDWRLPNLFELESLRNMAFSNPCISNTSGSGQWTEGDPFTNVQSGYYWSGTTFASSTDYAWTVYMYNGYVYYHDKLNNYYAWPVRGGND